MDYHTFLKSKKKTLQDVGFELKTSYFNLAKKNLESAILKRSQSTLF